MTTADRPHIDAADRVLAWLSARGHASRAAVVRVGRVALGPQDDGSPLRTAMDLRRLGHVECLPPAHGRAELWTVTPPAFVRHATGEVLAYGRRTPRWRRQMREALAAASARLVVFREDRGPRRWRVVADAAALDAVARKLGVVVADEQGTRILRGLPSAAGAVVAEQTASGVMPADEWADRYGGAMRPEPLDAVTGRLARPSSGPFRGLARLRSPSAGRPVWAWADADGSCVPLGGELIRVAACATLAAGNAPAWTHDAAARTLAIPASWRRWLPVLIERPLCLAAGRLPTFTPTPGGGSWVYTHVDAARAAAAAWAAGAEL